MTGRDIAFLRKQAEQGFSPFTANKVLDELVKLRTALQAIRQYTLETGEDWNLGYVNIKTIALETLEAAP